MTTACDTIDPNTRQMFFTTTGKECYEDDNPYMNKNIKEENLSGTAHFQNILNNQ